MRAVRWRRSARFQIGCGECSGSTARVPEPRYAVRMKYPTRDELLELSPEDRLRLIEDVWDTLGEDPNLFPVSEEHNRTLDQRIEAYEHAPLAGSSWSEVRARIQKER